MPYPSNPEVAAALLAAAVALISLLVTLVSQRRGGEQAARRALLEPLRAEIAERIYSVVAYSVRSARAASPDAAAKYQSKAAEAAGRLDKLRHELRYPLWGLNDALHTLTLLPRWVDHARGQGERLSGLASRATSLRTAVDAAVSATLFSGNRPSWHRRCRVAGATWRLRRYFAVSKPLDLEGEP